MERGHLSLLLLQMISNHHKRSDLGGIRSTRRHNQGRTALTSRFTLRPSFRPHNKKLNDLLNAALFCFFIMKAIVCAMSLSRMRSRRDASTVNWPLVVLQNRVLNQLFLRGGFYFSVLGINTCKSQTWCCRRFYYHLFFFYFNS